MDTKALPGSERLSTLDTKDIMVLFLHVLTHLLHCLRLKVDGLALTFFADAPFLERIAQLSLLTA